MSVEESSAGPRIVLVGYQGRSAEELTRLLCESGVTDLADVRLNAVSRVPGLSKTRLRDRLHASGIAYAHLRALGNPKDNRDGFRASGADGPAGRFRALLGTDAATADLAHAAELARRGTLALLCFERDPQTCHRHVVAEALVQRLVAARVESV